MVKIHYLDKYLLNTDLGAENTTATKTHQGPDLQELPLKLETAMDKKQTNKIFFFFPDSDKY